MIDLHHGWNVSFKPQVQGFIISLLLTIAAYRMVMYKELSNSVLEMTVAGFAVSQVILQLIFFLHLGLESKPRWNMITFLFTLLVVFLIIGGSLWIMNHLNYHLMMPMEHN